MKTKHFPLIPNMANDSFLGGNEGNREYEGNRGTHARLGKSRGESQLERHFVGFPREKLWKTYSRGIGDAWHPSKTKVGSCYNHKTNPEICKKTKTSDNQIFSLSHSIPTKATTTELAQKLEKHPKPIKTMFNQWVAERAFV